MISLLFQSPIIFVLVTLALVLSISVHEFSHAYVAYKLGDDTPKYLGRVTLNPKAHLDPIGFLSLLIAGFGWGKPVPFNPLNLKNVKRDSALISLAGPFSNFLFAFILSLLINLFKIDGIIGGFLYLTILYNLTLGFFNLLPIYPLDGFKVVLGVLPDRIAIQWQQMENIGVYILLLLVVTGSVGKIISPLVDSAIKLLGL